MKEVALQLPVEFSELKKIEEGHAQISDRVLNALHAWLESDTEASWKKVVDALRSIDKNVLAKEIEEEFCRHPATQPSTIPTTGPSECTIDTSCPQCSIHLGLCIHSCTNLPVLPRAFSAYSVYSIVDIACIFCVDGFTYDFCH